MSDYTRITDRKIELTDEGVKELMEPADWIEDIEEVSAQRQWLKVGYDNGWISDAFCSTHDGVPWTDEEEAEWEDGGDPCALCFRFYE